MILKFPSADVLQLALSSQVIADNVQCSPARLAVDDDSAIYIDASRTISRATMKELRQLGVQSKKRIPQAFRDLLCWHQAIPLCAAPSAPEIDDKTEVLFDLDDQQSLPSLVNEILRLGNDRQSFRIVDGKPATRTLLRVTSPPYYTLLRAIDPLSVAANRSPGQINAYVQQRPRVWVPFGFHHPLAPRIQPPAGSWLLISPENQWQYITEKGFRDIYESMEFSLPQAAEHLQEHETTTRIRVPLRLTADSSQDPAQLWVLSNQSLDQVERLVKRSDDRLLSRLAFAVTSHAGSPEDGERDPLVIIRARPSREPLPVLVLDAVAFRSYLRIPNLFLPTGQRLQPPLRRDAVRELFCQQSEQITWLMPRDPTPDEQQHFVPHSIPDTAFRPLNDWIDYVIDHQAPSLQAWVASHRFDFEHFVCREDEPTTPPASPNKKGTPAKPTSRDPLSVSEVKTIDVTKKKSSRRNKKSKSDLSFIQTPKPAELSKLQRQLRAMETEFERSRATIGQPRPGGHVA